MGRKALFQRSDMSGAALRLVAERGPQAVTMADVAREVGAPTGSIYHRYQSRDQLLAELWMDVVEGFQRGFIAALDRAHDLESAVEAAGFMASWARAHPLETRVLLLHRRHDFVTGQWPAALAERAAVLEPQLGQALRAYAQRACGGAGAETMARLRFALLDAPFGGLKPYVQAGKPIPRAVDQLVAEAARAVLVTTVRFPRTGSVP
jgi:AcrR family transcriptional regulator